MRIKWTSENRETEIGAIRTGEVRKIQDAIANRFIAAGWAEKVETPSTAKKSPKKEA